MADGSGNPFATAGATSAPAADDSTARPFARGGAREEVGAANLSKSLKRKVKDLGEEAGAASKPTPRAGNLNIKDLNDLAAEFSGLPSSNPKVTALSIEDLNSLEAVFFDVKMNAAKAAREAAAEGAEEGAPIFDDWSCCCCTPCCCCAAAETSPFAAR